ncbi:MAG: bifunctional GNAT family N-acetyltransferase/acetate--CoA ligase family protein [Acidimicrobiia bacterium]|nr:MAG: bifunctional GNAT family N-acetyltransferase/acetate--CoA ligase family protein [Acidimicrobiia bacterium]
MSSATVSTTIADPPSGYPGEWEQDAVLRDGGTVRIRPIVPADAPALQALVHNMSTQSSYFRFFRVKRELEPEELKAFTEIDYRSDMAFVAIVDGNLVGVGRYNAIDNDPTSSEIAFTIADAFQGIGIGTLLVFRISAYARALGIERFRAYLLADNHAMMRVFRNAGFSLSREIDEGVYTVEIPTEESDAVLAAEGKAEQISTAASLLPLFYPQSIAVIGASRNKSSIGGRLFNNIINADFMGPVYPVNPKTSVVRSIPTYASVLDIPGKVDLAFIVVPAAHVLNVVRECAEKGVKGLVVISAGFSEVGEAGARAERELVEIVRSAGMRMVGPNGMGLLNTDPAINLDGQFGPIMPPKGNVAMSSQSGALGLAILDYATELGIGISTFVSVGNKADVSGNDLLLFWEEDPNTDVILLYLESFGNPRRFARIARRIGMRKPIIAVKSGRTAAGARAASSHTGSLASLDTAVDALFTQAGVIRVDTLEELFNVASLLSSQPLPRGRNVGVITNAGGPAILAVDALESQGLAVPKLSDDLQAELRTFLSDEAAVANPIDMIAAAGPAEYKKAIETMLATDEIDALIALYIPASDVGAPETATAIREAAEASDGEKTFLSVYMNSSGVPSELASTKAKFPAFPFPERAAMALRKAVEYSEWIDKPTGHQARFDDIDRTTAREVMDAACVDVDTRGAWLDPDAVDAILTAYGLEVPKAKVVRSVDAAIAFADEVGGPMVLKVISPSAVHKSDVGGVELDISGALAVTEAYERVTSAVPDPAGVLVQEFVAGGHEVLIGTVEDPNFGPLIVFGLGGVFVELIGDVAFRILPLTDVEAREMIGDVKSARLLEGYRGGDPGDIDAVVDALLRVSALIEDLPEVFEMDLNPVKVGTPGSGVRIVDARIRVRPVLGSWIPSRTDLPSML